MTLEAQALSAARLAPAPRMVLRTFGDESEALRFKRSIALAERREPLIEASATPQIANRLMKKSNSVDKGDDFLSVR